MTQTIEEKREYARTHMAAKIASETPEQREHRLARQRAYYHANKDQFREYGDKRRKAGLRDRAAECAYARKSKYGLTPEQFVLMILEQNGFCAACGTDQPGGRDGNWHVDHNHDTGVVRGLLCMRCNRTMGLAGDDPDLLLQMAAYLLQSSDVLAALDGQKGP